MINLKNTDYPDVLQRILLNGDGPAKANAISTIIGYFKSKQSHILDEQKENYICWIDCFFKSILPLANYKAFWIENSEGLYSVLQYASGWLWDLFPDYSSLLPEEHRFHPREEKSKMLYNAMQNIDAYSFILDFLSGKVKEKIDRTDDVFDYFNMSFLECKNRNLLWAIDDAKRNINYLLSCDNADTLLSIQMRDENSIEEGADYWQEPLSILWREAEAGGFGLYAYAAYYSLSNLLFEYRLVESYLRGGDYHWILEPEEIREIKEYNLFLHRVNYSDSSRKCCELLYKSTHDRLNNLREIAESELRAGLYEDR